MSAGSRSLYYVPPWTHRPAADGRMLVRAQTVGASPVETDALTVQILARSTGARTLEEHAACIQQICPATEDTIRALLDGLQDCGLLRRLPEPGRDATDRPARISIVGIPTADRPDVVRAALADALDHVERRGADIRTFVLDGSSHSEHQTLTQHLVERAPRDRACYIGQRDRTAVVNRLAAAGFDRGLLRSAVGGGAIGSQRNLLLLLGAGRGLLMVDDDIRWTVWRPRTYRPGVAVAGHAEHREHRFFAGREETLSEVDREPADLLTLHESLLGHSLRNLVDDRTDLANACGHVLDLLSAPRPARVRVTMTGLAGDSGTYCPHLRLLGDGTLRAALSASQEAFDLALSSREVRRAASRATVGHDPRCMAGCMAVDDRELLPPFMWHGGNEDGMFGVMLAAVDRSALFGHLAAGVVHDSQRPSSREAGPIRSATQTRLADLLLVMSQHATTPTAANPDGALVSLASQFRQLAEQPLAGFRGFVRDSVLEVRNRQLARLESIADDDGYPDYWRAAAIRFREQCVESMKDAAFFCPIEFRRPDQPLERSFADARAAVREFAELVAIWPELWNFARQLGRTLLES